jgi:hypothetical protein
MEQGRARPVPREIAELDSLDSRVIWEYIGHDPPLNARRTLDQYGYPSLRDTYARDDDQMLYKLTKERLSLPLMNRQEMYRNQPNVNQPNTVSPALVSSVADLLKSETASNVGDTDEDIAADLLEGNVLMVDQLWLWVVDNCESH